MGLSSVGVIFAMIFTGHFHFAGLKLFGFFLLGSALFFLSFSSEYHRVQSDMIQIFKAEVIIE